MLSSRSDATGVLFHAPKAANGKVSTSGGTSKGIPKCGNCGSARVYEMQLTPQAIEELEKEEDVGLDGMDWQTIIVGFCEKDCGIQAEEVGTGKVKYLEEWCGVQWEELVAR
jgi:pre-rRNA-processing protein TSR4